MTTLVAHLRIAEKLLEYGFELEKRSFLLGNLAPDVGGVAKKITHYIDDDNHHIQPEDFYQAKLRDQEYDSQTYAFLLGYYVHLLADNEWMGNVWRPLVHDVPEIATRIKSDSDFAYQFNRREYFGHDMVFLHENPDYSAWKTIRAVEAIPTYLDFLSGDVLLNWLNTEVKSAYDDASFLQMALQHDFPYLSRSDLQTWLDCAICTIVGMLHGKQVPCPNPHPLWGDYIQPYA